MTTDLIAIGNGMRDAYRKSLTDGHSYMNRFFGGRGLRVFHVPELPGDGHLIPPEDIGKGVDAEVTFLSKIEYGLAVESVRQIDADTLVIETIQSGKAADGKPFRFPNTQVYTFHDGMVERIIEVASAEMWSTIGAALAAVGVGHDPKAGLIEVSAPR